MRIKQAFATGLLAMTPALVGCLSHTRLVPKTRRADVVLDAPLDQLLQQVDDRYDAIQTMTATVQIVVTTGGSLQGEVKEYIAASGYIIVGKPDNIRALFTIPLVGTRAFDMVSDGTNFKVYIPIRNRAIVGPNEVTAVSKNSLENLRPSVILDSVLVRGLGTGHVVSMTQDIRVIENPRKKNDLIEEPDYDLEFLSEPANRIARTLRVIHISRANLLPYQQDIYDTEGRIVTRATYENYQKFGTTNFPSKIVIKRPLDQYSLAITITKATFNQELPADQFKLDIPDGVPTQNMADPASPLLQPRAAPPSPPPTSQTAPHGPQSLD